MSRRPTNDDTPRLTHGGVLALLSETLVAILCILDDADDSAHVRELRARAHSYKRIVAMWTTVPPSRAQRDATFDLVMALHAQAAEANLDAPRGRHASARAKDK